MPGGVFFMLCESSTARIAVIMPVYRAEATLEKAVESLFAQSYPNWRAYLSDDASPDGSYKKMLELASRDPRIVCLHSEKNGGASRARNLALERAEQDGYDYLAFLDSDDWWDERMLEVLLDAALRNEAQIVQCEWLRCYPDGSAKEEKLLFDRETVFGSEQKGKLLKRMMSGISMNHAAKKLVAAETAQGLRFNESLRTAEDLDYCFRLLMRTAVYVFVPDRFYMYYQTGTGLTGSSLKGIDKWKANVRVAELMRAGLKGTAFDTLYYRLLTRLRPLRITLSKIKRTLAEKLS